MPEYPWYNIAGSLENIEQGDIIIKCPNVIPLTDPFETPDYETDIKVYNVMVMSQSCDIENRKIESVLVCPVWSLKQMAANSKKFESQKKQLYDGKISGYHLLDQCLIKEINGSIVDYKLPTDSQEIEKSILGYDFFKDPIVYKHSVSYNDHLVVDFRYAFSVPLNFLLEIVEKRGERLRLLPPFREHLSQSYARFIMRVGLPKKITPFL